MSKRVLHCWKDEATHAEELHELGAIGIYPIATGGEWFPWSDEAIAWARQCVAERGGRWRK